MSVTSGFFNSVNGDRVYNADDLTNFWSGVLDDGVFRGYDGTLAVSAGSGMSVDIAGGKAVVYGKFIKNTGILNLPVAGGGTLPRYDAVVCGTDLQNRSADIYIKQGTPANSPQYPAMNNNENAKEICLAYIYVPAGASAIAASNITDQRADQAVCGYVKFTNISASLNVLRNSVRLTAAGTSNVRIGIPVFDAEHDTLMVYLNGLLMMETEEYTVKGTGSAASIDLVNAVTGTSDNWITFVVYKMVV